MRVLLDYTGLRAEQIDHFVVAGTFDTYLHLESAIAIGMFPDLPRYCYCQIDNAPGDGAQMRLVSEPGRQPAEALVDKMT